MPPETKKHTVLIVDDEARILASMARTLRNEGYKVLFAHDGLDAIEQLKRNAPLSVILSDHKMPGIEGTRFLSAAKKISPHSTRIMLTGCKDFEIMEHSINNAEVFRFLTKPLNNDLLKDTIRSGVDRYEKIMNEIGEGRRKDEVIRKLSLGIERSPVSVVITDSKGDIEFANGKFLESTGYTFAETKGRNLCFFITREKCREQDAELWETIAIHKKWRGELIGKKKNGGFFWEYVSISPVKTMKEEITHFITLGEDITALKQSRELLTRTRDKAAAAAREKRTFLAKISQELRAPMEVLLDCSEGLQGESETKGIEKFIPHIQKIRSAGAHILDLADKIRDLSEVDTERIEINLGNVELAKIIQDIDSVIQPLAEENDNQFEVHTGPDLEFTCSHPDKLQQVLVNLLKNACKYTTHGTVSLIVDSVNQNDREWFLFKIKDTGIGMTPEQCSRIFDEFIHVESPNGKTLGGAGLGLTISKLFCGMMGADIAVESELGKGSTFSVRLPK